MIKPHMDYIMAKEMAQRLYGFNISDIKEMVSYDDRNFHIQVSSENRNPFVNTLVQDGYTLKVTNTVDTASPGHFESIHCALNHLHEKGLRVPLPVRNLEGNSWSVEKVPLQREFGSSEEEMTSLGFCGVRLLTYIPGFPINTVTYTKNILYQWGRLLAECHNSLQDFSNEILYKKDFFWNLSHVPDIFQFTNGLNKEQLELVTNVLKSHKDELQPVISLMPKGYIHGDFNETNILVRKTPSGYVVDGILDLDHMHYGTYVWDVGLMLAYVSLGCEEIDPIEGMGHALAGYFELRALTMKEISLLKICIASRLCQSLVMGAYNFKLDPTNSYRIISARSGWNRLKVIWNTPNEDILKKWDNIRKF